MTKKSSQEVRDLSAESRRRKNQRQTHRRLGVAARVVLGGLFLVALGTLLLSLPIMSTGERLTLVEALFTSTSAVTVTGLSVIAASTDLTLPGQLTLLALIQTGGVGFMFAAALAMRLIGLRVSILSRLALTDSLGLQKPGAILKILQRSVVGIAVIELIGLLLLWLHWSLNDIVPDGDVFLYALFHSVSAFCNAGFDLFNGLASYPGGIPNDEISLLIMGALIFLGGLGIPVLGELFAWTRGHHWSLHLRVTAVTVLGLLFLGWVGYFIPEALGGGVLAGAPLGEQLVRTWFSSVSARTAGFAGLPNFDQIRPASQLLTIFLMFIGCAPASMGGGITTGTFSVLILSLKSYVIGEPQAVAWKRTIGWSTVRRASAVVTISLLLVSLSTFVILISHPGAEMTPVVFEVVSAFATCGLSLGFTGELNTLGRLIVMVMMFWGRLGALTIVLALAQKSTAAALVQYPEENLLIG